jgi:hypothetical protein
MMEEHVYMMHKCGNGQETRSAKIQVMVTPSFKQKLEQFLGPIPMSRFFFILAEWAINEENENGKNEKPTAVKKEELETQIIS